MFSSSDTTASSSRQSNMHFRLREVESPDDVASDILAVFNGYDGVVSSSYEIVNDPEGNKVIVSYEVDPNSWDIDRIGYSLPIAAEEVDGVDTRLDEDDIPAGPVGESL